MTNVVIENDMPGCGKLGLRFAMANPVAPEIKGDAIVPMPATKRTHPNNLTNPIINSRLSKIKIGSFMAAKKSHPSLSICTDGGSRGNPGNAAYAFIIEDEKGLVLFKRSKFIGKATNNVAEYTALIRAMEKASAYCTGDISCFSDSEFMIDQLNGKDKVRKKHIRELYSKVKDLEKSFKSVKYSHLPRENPKIARVDRLVNKELDKIERN